jgi:hypothetical protein
MNFKIFDIGGSFTKIYDSSTKNITKLTAFEEPIINLNKLKNLIIDNININTDYIAFSSQMHGFVLFDDENNNISDFITWRNSSIDNILHNSVFDDFYITGLKKRNDLPINNLAEYIQKNNIKNKKLYFKNITEAILDHSTNQTHITMACGSGFLNIVDNKYINNYIKYFKDIYNVDILFDEVICEKKIIGYINKFDKKIPVYCGLGDFQASVYASPFTTNTLFINMATGSQVALLHDTITTDELFINKNIFSYRPYFNNSYIKCITHIPSGRFLNIFNKFFSELNFNIWEYFNTITLEDYNNSNIIINTDIFSNQGISILNIFENNFNIKNLIISILRNFLLQYINIINNNKLNFDNIFISGGIAKKIIIIKKIFETEFKKPVSININDDDSIYGTINFLQNN